MLTLARCTEVCGASLLSVLLYDGSFPSGTAIETSIRATVRLSVLKDLVRTALVKSPHFSTSRSPPATEESYCTTGVGPGARSFLVVCRHAFMPMHDCSSRYPWSCAYRGARYDRRAAN